MLEILISKLRNKKKLTLQSQKLPWFQTISKLISKVEIIPHQLIKERFNPLISKPARTLNQEIKISTVSYQKLLEFLKNYPFISKVARNSNQATK